MIKTLKDLEEKGWANEDLGPVIDRFRLSITSEMEALIENPGDAMGRQFIPTKKELEVKEEELKDPIGDERKQAVKGVVHRYPDRCLLMPMTVCPVYCRFCFRREKVGSQEYGLSAQELESAFQYIENTKALWEVIITGGDPLFMRPSFLGRILRRLSSMKHIRVLRIHTRVPLVDPKRISQKMLDALKIEKALYICIHGNHPKEFTPEAKSAISLLAKSGIALLSQTVLLRGINDNGKVLESLMRCFVENCIKPYYLHQGDMAEGTGHFRVPIDEGLELIKNLRGRVSGLCQPSYVLDIPGGFGKVPLQYSYWRGNAVEDIHGVIHPCESE